jgi:hypothetical protein
LISVNNILLRMVYGLLSLTPLSTIFQLYIVALVLLMEETEVPGENHRPVASN